MSADGGKKPDEETPVRSIDMPTDELPNFAPLTDFSLVKSVLSTTAEVSDKTAGLRIASDDVGSIFRRSTDVVESSEVRRDDWLEKLLEESSQWLELETGGPE